MWIPGTVASEMRHNRTPAIVREWAKKPPLHEVAVLDRGEWEAIELVRVAREQGFKVVGTLGVLVEGARSGLISIDEALTQLAKTNFRGTPDLFVQTQELVHEIREGDGG